MKPATLIQSATLIVLTIVVPVKPVQGAQSPKEALKSIATFRNERIAEEKNANGRVNYAALNNDTMAKAKAAVKAVSPETVDLAEAVDWIVVMEQGRVRAQGTTREVLYDDALFAQLDLPRPVLLRVARAAGYEGVLGLDELVGVMS